jgi:hypothetical protein
MRCSLQAAQPTVGMCTLPKVTACHPIRWQQQLSVCVPCASRISCLHGASLPSIKHTASDTCLGKRRARGNCPACTHSGVANGATRTVFVATIHALLVCSNVKQQQLAEGGTVPSDEISWSSLINSPESPTQPNCQPHTFSPGSPYNDCTRPGICVARTHFSQSTGHSCSMSAATRSR